MRKLFLFGSVRSQINMFENVTVSEVPCTHQNGVYLTGTTKFDLDRSILTRFLPSDSVDLTSAGHGESVSSVSSISNFAFYSFVDLKLGFFDHVHGNRQIIKFVDFQTLSLHSPYGLFDRVFC